MTLVKEMQIQYFRWRPALRKEDFAQSVFNLEGRTRVDLGKKKEGLRWFVASFHTKTEAGIVPEAEAQTPGASLCPCWPGLSQIPCLLSQRTLRHLA